MAAVLVNRSTGRLENRGMEQGRRDGQAQVSAPSIQGLGVILALNSPHKLTTLVVTHLQSGGVTRED